jgi:predicted MFS family arabinose efflux permease
VAFCKTRFIAMRTLEKLTFSAFGMHTADQIAVTAVPLLAAVVFNAPLEIIGLLVACQALAHLLGSIPFGVLVDRVQAKWAIAGAALISAAGFAAAAAGSHWLSLPIFGVGVTFAGFGIVLFVLAGLSVIPKIANTSTIATANAKVEMARAIPALAAPLLVGLLVDRGLGGGVFILAAVAAMLALSIAVGFPGFEKGAPERAGAIKAIFDGGGFVIRQPLLRAIAACAVFWNLAFAALLAILAPLLLDFYGADPSSFGIALSVFGSAVIAGTWVAGRISHAIAPAVILILGPGSSFAASLLFLVTPADGPVVVIYAIFFGLGFGPSMWLVAQNSIRQLVTPAHMLGCVNAVIQTAIYGMRPIGALAGGFIAGALSPQAAAGFVVVAFGLSLASALFSPLRSIQSFALLQPTAR